MRIHDHTPWCEFMIRILDTHPDANPKTVHDTSLATNPDRNPDTEHDSAPWFESMTRILDTNADIKPGCESMIVLAGANP